MGSLVVDANIVVSALLKNSVTRKELLCQKTEELFAPDFINEELLKYSEEFARRLKSDKKQIEETIGLIFDTAKIQVIAMEEYCEFLPKALQISPDKNDVPYFALALKLSCPLWSNDKALKKQSKVKVLSTSELPKEQ